VTAPLAGLLRNAVESGDWTRFRKHLDPGAVFDSSNESGRHRVEGADAILAHLEAPGPGEVRLWQADEWSEGLALTFEWAGDSGADRRRWYVRRDPDGTVSEVWSTAARPSDEDGVGTAPPDGLLQRLGAKSVVPLSHGGNSGAALVRANGERGSFVLKRISAEGADWLARATGDQGRTALLYEAGVFQRMPGSIAHGIVAAERRNDAVWVAMRDVAGQLLAPGAVLTREQSRDILRAAADLHRAFRGEEPPGAATLESRLGMSSRRVGAAERSFSDLLPKQFEQGWDAFGELVDPDVADPVTRLAEDPAPLAAAIRNVYGTTLIHGDLRGDNLGFADGRLVLIDWDLATCGSPGVEFAWYLAHSARRIDVDRDAVESDHLRAQGEEFIPDEHELGLLSGLVQYGWRIAHSARIHPDPAETRWGREELDWWVPRARAALDAVSGLLSGRGG
jgi:Ser/Thr protein kinase RdoA (MazF antagonist)